MRKRMTGMLAWVGLTLTGGGRVLRDVGKTLA